MAFRKNLNIGIEEHEFKKTTIRKAYLQIEITASEAPVTEGIDLSQLQISESLSIGGEIIKSYSNAIPRALDYGIREVHNPGQSNQGLADNATPYAWLGNEIGIGVYQIIVPLAKNLVLKQSDCYKVQTQWNQALSVNTDYQVTIYLIAEDGTDIEQPTQSLVMYEPVVQTLQQQSFNIGTVSSISLLSSSKNNVQNGGIANQPWSQVTIASQHYNDDFTINQLVSKRMQNWSNNSQMRNFVPVQLSNGLYLYDTTVELLINQSSVGTADTFISYTKHHPNSWLFQRFIKRGEKTLEDKVLKLS